MGKRFTLTVRRNGATLFRLRLPSLSSAVAAARRYAEQGTAVKIRPAVVNVRTALRAS